MFVLHLDSLEGQLLEVLDESVGVHDLACVDDVGEGMGRVIVDFGHVLQNDIDASAVVLGNQQRCDHLFCTVFVIATLLHKRLEHDD